MPRGAVRRRAVQERVDLPFDFGVEIVGHRQSGPFAHAEREEARVQAPAPFDCALRCACAAGVASEKFSSPP